MDCLHFVMCVYCELGIKNLKYNRDQFVLSHFSSFLYLHFYPSVVRKRGKKL